MRHTETGKLHVVWRCLELIRREIRIGFVYLLPSPDPTLTWSKLNGSMPRGRYSLLNFNSQFHIRDVQMEDEDDYRCRASNTVGSGTDEIIQIDVQCECRFDYNVLCHSTAWMEHASIKHITVSTPSQPRHPVTSTIHITFAIISHD